MKYILVSGGVVSGIGKGVIGAPFVMAKRAIVLYQNQPLRRVFYSK
jgi:CTP synthase (UTP-ammonia lyase)